MLAGGFLGRRLNSPLWLVPVVVFGILAFIPWFPQDQDGMAKTAFVPPYAVYFESGDSWTSTLVWHLAVTFVLSALICAVIFVVRRACKTNSWRPEFREWIEVGVVGAPFLAALFICLNLGGWYAWTALSVCWVYLGWCLVLYVRMIRLTERWGDD